MQTNDRIYVAGGDTLIGAAILRQLQRQGFTHLLGGSSGEPDLNLAVAVDDFFDQAAPEYVFIAAGKSGGIEANRKYPADLMLDNLRVECHLIDSAYRHDVKKLLYLASSCCYPKHCQQPMRVESLLSGPLEPTNEAYGLAKIAGLKLCQAYRQQYGANFVVGIPANTFGSGDDFSTEDSHVIAALIGRLHAAKITGAPTVEIWGTGTPRREFIFVDDLAEACITVMQVYAGLDPINLGSGLDLSIAELAELIREVVGYVGELRYDPSRPDGMPLKALDSSQLTSLGWRPATTFRSALTMIYAEFLQTQREHADGP